jgi:hypothetical protein
MNRYQSCKPELLEMIDMYRKYIRPYKTGHGRSTTSEPQYLPRMNGRKKLQRKRFETYREFFTGSKYQSSTFTTSENNITCRINGSGGTITLIPYCDMYPYMK